MQSPYKAVLMSLLALAALVGCAPAGDHKVWRDASYTGGPLKKVFVIGLSSTSLADHRGFEDLMVGQIRAAGGQAVPGYQFISQDAVPNDATIAAAVTQSGADGVLITRLAGFQLRNYALQNPYPSMDVSQRPDPAIYGGPGGGPVAVATIYSTVFAANGMNPIFTYDPKTYDPGDFDQQAPRYANLLVSYMQSNGFLQTQMLPR
ncbi:MAG: hypothetical protein ABI777_10730 [Betaproteobacteria bacterium]